MRYPSLDEFRKNIKLISCNETEQLKAKYITKFVNTQSEYYKNRIEILEQFSDGMCYTGYLWDCLKDTKIIKIEDVNAYAVILGKVLVFWDIHSKDRIWIDGYWKFDKHSILQLNFKDLIDNLEYLPEDIYIFDEELNWTLVLTHEDDNGVRICAKSGNI